MYPLELEVMGGMCGVTLPKLCDDDYQFPIREVESVLSMFPIIGYIWGQVNIVDAPIYSNKETYMKQNLEVGQERSMIALVIFWFGI